MKRRGFLGAMAGGAVACSVAPGTISHDSALKAERCRRSLSYFVRTFWDEVVPEKLVWNWHMDAVCDHLQAVTEDKIQRLIINIPPGSAKSTLVSVMWPAWEWIDHPGEQSLFGSYDESLALRDSVRCRKVFDSDRYRSIFQPVWRMSKDQNAKGFYTNTFNGNRYTFGLNSKGKTGWRGNKVVLDDPNDVKARFDSRVKANAWDVFASVLQTRVNDLLTAKFLIVQQRTSFDDFTGRIHDMEEDPAVAAVMEKIGKWETVMVPAEFDSNRRFFTSIGWTDPRSQDGENFFPKKYPDAALEGMRLSLGDEGFEGQFNQSPAPAGGMRFSRELFPKYKRVHGDIIETTNRHGAKSLIKLGLCWTFVSVDLAASEKQTADYTVFSVWAVTSTYDMLLMNCICERLSEPKIIEKAIALHTFTGYNGRKHVAFVVEANGLGLPIAQAMAAKGLPTMEVHIHRTDKLARSATAVIRASAGGIYLPEDGPEYPWKEPWLRQHERFPGDEHDDMVDATSLAASALFDMGIAGLNGGEYLKNSKKSAHEVMEPKKAQILPAVPSPPKNLPVATSNAKSDKRFFS